MAGETIMSEIKVDTLSVDTLSTVSGSGNLAVSNNIVGAGTISGTNITASGTLGVTGLITASAGVAIGGTGSVNTLDDYEEGDFTPTLTPGGGSYNGLTLTGKYTKIGRVVTVQMRLKIDASGNASNSATVGGLPFTSLGSWNRMPNKWRENTATGACGQFVVNQGSTSGFMQNDDGSNIAHTTGREYLINAVYYSA
jgi:hypothetical protein